MMRTFGFPNIIMLSGLAIFFGAIVLGLFIWALIDCLSSKRDSTEKLLWILIIILFNVLGSILYLAIGRRNQVSTSNTKKYNTKSSSAKSGRGKKKLERDTSNMMLEGVCSGFAKYFDMDVTIIRLLWVLMTFMTSGSGIILYIVMAIVMPPDNITKKQKSVKKKKSKTWLFVLLILLFILVPIIIVGIGFVSFMTISHSEVNESIVGVPRDRIDSVIVDNVLISDKKNVEVTIDSISYKTDLVSKEIIANYNFQNYDGYNLVFLGNYPADQSDCENNVLGVVASGRDCMKFDFRYNVDTDELPDNVNGFHVSALLIKGQIASIEFTEVGIHTQ